MAIKKLDKKEAQPTASQNGGQGLEVKPRAIKKTVVKKTAVKKVVAEKKVEVVKEPKVDKVDKVVEVKAGGSLMDQLMAKATIVSPKKGQQLEGVVTFVSKKLVLVDIGAKTEGMVTDDELKEAADLIEDIKVGDKISVFVKYPENDQGQVLLSLRKAIEEGRWAVFKKWMDEDKEVEVTGLEVNKGGMVVKVGDVRGFVPASQFGEKYLGNMELLLNKNFKAKVIEVDRAQNRLILSEKLISDAEGLAKKDEALTDVVVGAKLSGTVSGIMPFGVFVTVNVPIKAKKETGKLADSIAKVEGLVHISEISWEKVDDPNIVFKVGQEVDVMVIGIDKEMGKLNLSIKQLFGDPWKEIEVKYAVGTKHIGKVVRMAPYGVFVNFDKGIDGLIHVSKQPQGKEFRVGEEVHIYVEMLDVKARRMSLGVVLTEVPVEYR
jgi:small subunit ribosomal protein S1